jgi:exoribonuclease-2
MLAVVQQTAAPFAPKDSDLFAIISAFDVTYKAYADFQSNMERYWCLKWLEQHEVKQVLAVVLREEIVRLADIPLTLRVTGMSPQGRGTRLRLDILSMDFVSLELECRLIEILAQANSEISDEETLPDSDDEDSTEIVDSATPKVQDIQVQLEGESEVGDG